MFILDNHPVIGPHHPIAHHCHDCRRLLISVEAPHDCCLPPWSREITRPIGETPTPYHPNPPEKTTIA